MAYSTATEQKADEQKEIRSFRLATVSSLFEDGCPKIRFNGEEVDSEKKYKVIEGTSYAIGDIVLVGIIGDGYVVLGAISYEANRGTTTDYITLEEAQDLFATISHTHSNYSLTTHTHNRLRADDSFDIHFTAYSGSSTGYGLLPSVSGNCDLGSSSYKLRTIYATTSTISTSDKNQKKEIDNLDERYIKLFKILEPKRYKFKDGQSKRFHTGFIAQDVEKAMIEAGISDIEFAALIKSPKISKSGKQLKGYDYGLRYEEFIAPNTMMIQKLFEITERQEMLISEQGKRIEQLERRLTNG